MKNNTIKNLQLIKFQSKLNPNSQLIVYQGEQEIPFKINLGNGCAIELCIFSPVIVKGQISLFSIFSIAQANSQSCVSRS